MPSLQENRDHWNEHYDWSEGGEEWSWRFGGSRLAWYGLLLPRLQPFLPTGTVLEIGPGYGRWTHFLRRWAERLILVDLSAKCIDACRQRFADEPHLEFHVNDGRSLAMVDDGAVDLAFSFDSLVHVEAGELGAYLEGLASKLGEHGVAVLHHSNLATYRRYFALLDRLPGDRMALYRAGLIDLDHWRARSVSADGFLELCRHAGLSCVGQELINWGKNRRLIDCISVVTRPGSRFDRPFARLRNPAFMRSADHLAQLAGQYDFAAANGDDTRQT